MEIISWIASICSVSGNIGVIYKKVWGMWIWTIGSLIWVLYAVIYKNYSQLFMFIIYSILNIAGIIKWSKIEKGENYEN